MAEVDDASRLLGLLRCPSCDSSPERNRAHCPGCGRLVRTGRGGFDLLSDDRRVAADHFGERYRALRAREGWARATGGESPDGTRRWRDRHAAGARVAAIIERRLAGRHRPVVVDIGAGGGWMAELLPGAAVMAIDLMDVSGDGHALRIRGDMCELPLRDGVADAVLYLAAVHHAPIHDVTVEAARVLQPRGSLVVAESPIYPDPRSRDRAAQRSAEYYAGVGFPDLAKHYFPIELGELEEALDRSGFEVERLDSPRRRYGPLGRLLGRRAFPIVVARLTT